MRLLIRGATALTVAVTAAVTVAGCSFRGAPSIPLPGGVSGPTYRVTAVFADASNLEPKETCRANDVVVGVVSSVELNSRLQAVVVCDIKRSVHLPGNSVATLRSTSLLGERFVALGPPANAEAAATTLAAGTTIPADDTTTDPDAEQVLSALSALLNGGDLAKISTINQELNNALHGNEGNARALLSKVASITKELADHTDDIDAALDGLDRLSATIAGQRKLLGDAIDAIPDGLRVLERQRPALVTLLKRLQNLSRTAVPLIDRGQADIVADLQALKPVLSSLAATGKQLGPALGFLATYPFPRNALAAIKGDYAGFYPSFNFDLDLFSTLLTAAAGLQSPSANAAPSTTTGGTVTTDKPVTSVPVSQLPGLSGVLDGVLPKGSSVTTTPTVPGLLGLLSGNAP